MLWLFHSLSVSQVSQVVYYVHILPIITPIQAYLHTSSRHQNHVQLGLAVICSEMNFFSRSEYILRVLVL